MDELLQKLLEAEVLTEETRKELQEAFTTKITEAVETAKKEAADGVRAELTEQWVNERDALIEAVDAKVTDFLDSEFSELKDDIERFRDLEADYAQKLVEAKKDMAKNLKSDLAELVEKLDAFLEIRLRAELQELSEDINRVKKDEFGRKLFEAFVQEYKSNFADDQSLEGTLRETERRLADTTKALEESARKVAEFERTQKMTKVLSPLSGHQRDVMEAILKNVDTERLEEGYNTFIGRVLKETQQKKKVKEAKSEKEESVLAEGASNKKDKILKNTRLATGDNESLMEENKEQISDSQKRLTEETLARIRKAAGITV